MSIVVKVRFNLIQVNEIGESREVVFPYEGRWFRMDWNKVLERFKVLYVAMLKLQGLEVPEDLKEYERDTIDVSDIDIEIDLNQCEEIPEMYPLGG